MVAFRMTLADIDPSAFRIGGAVLGLLLGVGAIRLVDALPGRYGLVTAPSTWRTPRNVVLALLSTFSALAIAHVLAGAAAVPIAHGVFLLVTNAIVATAVLAAAATDFEHMILPDELTLAPAVVCLLTSPLRSVGFASSALGAVIGLAMTYLPLLLYTRLRGHGGMGLGDAKLAVMAGAWHGALGVIFVLLLGALQFVIGAMAMRIFGLVYPVPASVTEDLRMLRQRTEKGDEAAHQRLAADVMSGDARKDWPGMRLPFGPFLALACLEVLFARRWLVDHALAWF